MDLSTDQALMEMQNRYGTKYENHMFMMKETYEETDIKGNNNRFNSLKTEVNINHAHEPSSLFQGKCTKEKKLEVDNSLFSYSSFKKAMDLRTHNRTLDGRKRSIFDDAEYFAKNYCYKLLPITFEQVDETIIQSEHNYSLSSLNSESELEEDCSRTMDYSQVKEKNYKRRKTKFQDGEEGVKVEDDDDEEEEEEEEEMIESKISDGDRKLVVEPSSMLFHSNEDFATEFEHRTDSVRLETENSIPVQPLDLSAPPLVQEEKTDHHLLERPNSIVENDEIAQPDSDKENVNSELNGIRVTITRPEVKENYEPCDLFLNDIARLVPWLIDKDCFEVDILDRTCDHHDEFRNHRLYYVISETTWRLFQESNERIILTNDHSLGQPLTRTEKDEKPSYLVFDQFSLAKCLADYCKEIGGCFEYNSIEEGKDEGRSKNDFPGDEEKNIQRTPEEVKKENEIAEKLKKVEELKKNEKEKDVATEREENKVEANEMAEKEEERRTDEKLKTRSVSKRKKKEEKNEVKSINNQSLEKEGLREDKKETVCGLNTEEKADEKTEKKNSCKPAIVEVNRKRAKPEAATTKEATKQSRGFKRRKESPIQPEPNNCRITTRSKSTSGSETSQKSDKPVNRRGRKKSEAPTLPKQPPTKRNKPTESEDLRRKTRSGKVLKEVKANKPTGAAGARKRNEGSRGKIKGKEVEGRRLRSQKVAQGRGEQTVKTRARKR